MSALRNRAALTKRASVLTPASSSTMNTGISAQLPSRTRCAARDALCDFAQFLVDS